MVVMKLGLHCGRWDCFHIMTKDLVAMEPGPRADSLGVSGMVLTGAMLDTKKRG